MRSASADIVREIAATQCGYVAQHQAVAAGAESWCLPRLCTRGEVVRVGDGVYRFASAPEGWWSRVHATTLLTPRTGAVSHTAALRLLGLERLDLPYADEITVVGSAPLDAARTVVVHRTRRLDPCDLTRVDGIMCTNGARTVVDLAGRLGKVATTQVVDEVVCAGLAGRTWLYHRALQLQQGRAGVGVIVRLVGPEAEAGFRSWLERCAHALLRRYDLPPGQWNVVLPDCRGAGEVDTLLPGRVVIEWDGLRFHVSPRSRQRDDDKGNELVAAGYRVLRFTWYDVVVRPEYVVASIRAVLSVNPGCVA